MLRELLSGRDGLLSKYCVAVRGVLRCAVWDGSWSTSASSSARPFGSALLGIATRFVFHTLCISHALSASNFLAACSRRSAESFVPSARPAASAGLLYLFCFFVTVRKQRQRSGESASKLLVFL